MVEFASVSILLIVVLSLLSENIQTIFSKIFFNDPNKIFLVPFLLTAFICLASIFQGRFGWSMFMVSIIYTYVPTAIIYKIGHGWQADNYPKDKTWLDFWVILILWLPVEYASFTGWLRIYLGNLSHVVSWGAAVVLGLFLFLCFRSMSGMKYNLPKKISDLMVYALGFVAAAVILIPFARMLSFMNPFHIPPALSASDVSKVFLAIFLGVALPEELLFRGLIQAWLVHKFGVSKRVIVWSAFIFGLSHIDNYTRLGGAVVFSPPNWPYVLIASLAGIIYGLVFLKSSSITIPAALHASVNTVRHTFFG